MIKKIGEDKLIDALYTAFYSGYMQSLFHTVGIPKDLESLNFKRINNGFIGICGDIMNSLKEKENSLKLLRFNTKEEMNPFK